MHLYGGQRRRLPRYNIVYRWRRRFLLWWLALDTPSPDHVCWVRFRREQPWPKERAKGSRETLLRAKDPSARPQKKTLGRARDHLLFLSPSRAHALSFSRRFPRSRRKHRWHSRPSGQNRRGGGAGTEPKLCTSDGHRSSSALEV